MSDLKAKLQQDMKDAMRARDSEKLGVIRLLLAAIKQREIDERIVLEDPQIFAVIDKMLRQRQESIAQFQVANRQDLVAKEKFEVVILQAYLPQQLTADEVTSLIDQAIAESQATSIKDMGKVVAILQPKAQGRTDWARVIERIKSQLGGQ